MLRLSSVARPAEALVVADGDKWVELSIGPNCIIVSESTFRQWLEDAKKTLDEPNRRRFDEWVFFDSLGKAMAMANG